MWGRFRPSRLLRSGSNELGNGAILWKSRGTDVCRRGCWCAAARASLTHGHAAGGIIYYMEKTIGFHVAGNGMLTMCAISWRGLSSVLLAVLMSAPWETRGVVACAYKNVILYENATLGLCGELRERESVCVCVGRCLAQGHVSRADAAGRRRGLEPWSLRGWGVCGHPAGSPGSADVSSFILFYFIFFPLGRRKAAILQGESSWTAQQQKKSHHGSPVIALRWQVGLFLHLPSK